MKMLATLIIISAVALLAACGGGESPAPAKPEPTSPPVIVEPTTLPEAVATEAPSGNVLKVVLQDPGGTGEYLFDPADLVFAVGETVTLELTSEGEYHTFTVDDLEIDVGVDAGATETLTFTFDEAGTFELICVPHLSFKMVGTITVK